jgi:putative aminopeptidase FrvX
MEKNKLERLTEILSVPSYSGEEDRMIKYLKGVLDSKGYEYTVDEQENIYITKGVSEAYPLFVAHTDTVHRVNENLRIKEYIHNDGRHVDALALRGYDMETNQPSGCGGDDKCGVYLALEMLDTLENVKVALFISEEIGCVGSRGAVKTNPEFFSNVGYAIQYDSPEGNSLSSTLMGEYLFEGSNVFTDKVGGLIREHGITKWERHPFTDVYSLMEAFDFCCLNLAAGYYRYHTRDEYVIVDDVQNGYNLGLKLFEVLGENKYVRPKGKKWEPTHNRQSSGPSVIVEELEPITQEEVTKMQVLQNKPLLEWSESEWNFYDDFLDRSDLEEEEEDDDFFSLWN